MTQKVTSGPKIRSMITLSDYFKNYLEGMVLAFKPKNLPFTLGISILSSVCGTLLTLFVFPGLFSLDPTVNAAYSGVAVFLTVSTVMNIVIGYLHQKNNYIAEITGTWKLWLQMFGKEIDRKERISAIIAMTIGLLLGCFFSHPFMVLLALAMWFLAVAGEKGQIMILVAALQNSLRQKYHWEHKIDFRIVRRNLAAMAVGMFVTALILGIGGLFA